jgi:DNA-binding HxlR family transcriptional regulator
MTTDAAGHTPELCSRFHRASELIGRRWTGAIIFVLLKGRCRFATLRAVISEITDRMLSERLQELEREGILERTVIPEMPVRVEYALTRKGRALSSTMDAIAAWAEKWIPPEDPAAAAVQRRRKPRVHPAPVAYWADEDISLDHRRGAARARGRPAPARG